MVFKCGAIPLQQPLTRTAGLAVQQLNPATGSADTDVTMGRRAGLGRDAPTGPRSANALCGAIPGMQQQGGNAGSFRCQLQTPALSQIQMSHLAHDHGQASTPQSFLYGPQALPVIPHPYQNQLLRAKTVCRQTRPIWTVSRQAPQHPASLMKCSPPGCQYGRKGQSRASPVTAQYFV